MGIAWAGRAHRRMAYLTPLLSGLRDLFAGAGLFVFHTRAPKRRLINS
jgi:hypothetical protein